MATNYAGLNRMKEAYQAMVEYDQIREKLFGEESTRKIAQMEMALELQEKEMELEAVEKDDQLKSIELHRTRLIIVVVFLVVLGAILLINLFLSRRKNPL